MDYIALHVTSCCNGLHLESEGTLFPPTNSVSSSPPSKKMEEQTGIEEGEEESRAEENGTASDGVYNLSFSDNDRLTQL